MTLKLNVSLAENSQGDSFYLFIAKNISFLEKRKNQNQNGFYFLLGFEIFSVKQDDYQKK